MNKYRLHLEHNVTQHKAGTLDVEAETAEDAYREFAKLSKAEVLEQGAWDDGQNEEEDHLDCLDTVQLDENGNEMDTVDGVSAEDVTNAALEELDEMIEEGAITQGYPEPTPG